MPPTAKVYFNRLWTARADDLWSDLDRRQQEFERNEFSKGRGPDGSGFAARLGVLYRENLAERAQVIGELVKQVHAQFGHPLDAAVGAQLRGWAEEAMVGVRERLEEALVRHLQRYGIQDIHPPCFDLDEARAKAGLLSEIPRYLWELRNVPAKHPSSPGAPTPVVFNITGSVGIVQAGAGAVANVQQQVLSGDTAALQSALSELRAALERAPEIADARRHELVTQVDNVRAELSAETPNRAKLLAWLEGIGTAVGTIANIQPAFEAVKAAASAVGRLL